MPGSEGACRIMYKSLLTNHHSLFNLLLFKISTTCWRDFLESVKGRPNQNRRSFLDAILIITNPLKKLIVGQTQIACLRKKNRPKVLMLFLNISAMIPWIMWFMNATKVMDAFNFTRVQKL